MTREAVGTVVRDELTKLTRGETAAAIDDDHLLSQLINSSGFLRLMIAVENQLSISIDDEDFYEASPVTVGDLVTFLTEQTAA